MALMIRSCRCCSVLCTLILAFMCVSLMWLPPDAFARGSGGSHATDHDSFTGRSHSKTDPGVLRDSHGHIKRSKAAKDTFKKNNPCPSTGESSGPCPGYVVDHVVPLKRGGSDTPANMQWQTKEEAKAKDKIE